MLNGKLKNFFSTIIDMIILLIIEKNVTSTQNGSLLTQFFFQEFKSKIPIIFKDGFLSLFHMMHVGTVLIYRNPKGKYILFTVGKGIEMGSTFFLADSFKSEYLIKQKLKREK